MEERIARIEAKMEIVLSMLERLEARQQKLALEIAKYAGGGAVIAGGLAVLARMLGVDFG